MAKAWNEGIVMRAIAGFLTLVPLWLALNTLRSAGYGESTHFGSMLILVVLGIVWSADIGAYYTGKNLGKRKLTEILGSRSLGLNISHLLLLRCF